MASNREEIFERLRSSMRDFEAREHEEGVSDEASSSPRTGVKKEPRKSNRDLNSSTEAFNRILRSLNVTDQAESSLVRKLQKDGYSESAIDEAIAHAKDLGFIDDERYARLYIRSMISKGKGIDGTIRDLDRMGIKVEEFEGWPSDYVQEGLPDETQRAWNLLSRRPPHGKNIRESAYRKLVSKGFDSGTASTVARKWAESQE